MSERPKRKSIPLWLKRLVVARQSGLCACGCGAAVYADGRSRFDHRPPLWLRTVNAAGTDFEPPQLDPAAIDGLTPDCHDLRSYGGKARATTLGSDAHENAKLDRLLGLTKKKPKRRWGSRPFQQGRGFQKRPKKKAPTRS